MSWDYGRPPGLWPRFWSLNQDRKKSSRPGSLDPCLVNPTLSPSPQSLQSPPWPPGQLLPAQPLITSGSCGLTSCWLPRQPLLQLRLVLRRWEALVAHSLLADGDSRARMGTARDLRGCKVRRWLPWLSLCLTSEESWGYSAGIQAHLSCHDTEVSHWGVGPRGNHKVCRLGQLMGVSCLEWGVLLLGGSLWAGSSRPPGCPLDSHRPQEERRDT